MAMDNFQKRKFSKVTRKLLEFQSAKKRLTECLKKLTSTRMGLSTTLSL